jgi:hypothetical protein
MRRTFKVNIKGLVWGLALSAAEVSIGTSFLVGLAFLIGCGLAGYYAGTSTNC